MKMQVVKYWDQIRSSLWFIPLVMTGGSMALAFMTVALDASMTDELQYAWGLGLFTAGAEGASVLLGTIAGSMITIAGVVFSMTLVALSLASSQLGPRLLRNFMRDTTTQVVLGTFISTFIYCLLVLRTIRRAEEVAFVPHLSVSFGVVLAVVSVGVLIYFIHHVSVSIQVNEVVAKVGEELINEVDRLFPKSIGRDGLQVPTKSPDCAFIKAFEQEAIEVGVAGDGYIEFVDLDILFALAIEEDVVLRLERRPGHYVVDEQPVVLIWPSERMSDQIKARIDSAFTLGSQRTPHQDFEFTVNQLVEIAVRALSPGLNDPFTAITCVDHLGSALCRLAQREIPSSYHYDEQEQLRMIAPVVTFAEVLDTAFNQIRQYGRSSAAVTICLLETIAVIARFAHRAEDLVALQRHADMIDRGSHKGLPESDDRRAVNERYYIVSKLLSAEKGVGRSLWGKGDATP
jgi:uncharacterized membrane protein